MRVRKQDWHPADIMAALRKKKMTLAALSRASGLSSSTLSNALYRSWPKGEKIIAEALGLSPGQIWPSRYYDPVTKTISAQKPLRAARVKQTGDREEPLA